VDGDESAGVRAVFEVAYARLAPVTRQVLRLLGAAPGQDISITALAALTGMSQEQAQVQVSYLVKAGLCDQSPYRRTRLHDLVREFAVTVESAPLHRELHRLFSHYHRTALAAVGKAVGGVTRLNHDPAAERARPLFFDTAESAAQWLEARGRWLPYSVW
jgi:hypothetical protein